MTYLWEKEVPYLRKALIILLCIAILAVPVAAESYASDLQSSVTVAENGTCRVSMTITVVLTDAPDAPMILLPKGAKSPALNGTSVRTKTVDGLPGIDLSRVITGAGTFTFGIQYSLSGTVTRTDKKTNLSIPLMTGLPYPVENMTFSVTLPGAPTASPTFTGSYLQADMAGMIQWNVQGNIISGSNIDTLLDRETVTLHLAVTEEMFPQTISLEWDVGMVDTVLWVCLLLAFLYWIVTMRCLPPKKVRRVSPPESLSAGDVRCCLTGQGADLTMMVLSWARLGYVLIQLDDNGRVLLHRRMNMGNERSDFENRCFRSLFGRRDTIDGTGYHYARLAAKAAASRPGVKNYFQKNSGNPLVFRCIACLVGLISGLALASALTESTAWQVLLSMLLAAVGLAVCWLLQRAFMSLHLRSHRALLMGIAGALLWLLLCIWGGSWNLALMVLLSQPVVGLAAAYGGRRTEQGKFLMSELLGLRRHLRTANPQELQRLFKLNPHYYYDIAPFAMAMGVDRSFARMLGGKRLPGCGWLVTGIGGHLTAREWNKLLRETVNALDERHRKLPLEQLVGK